MKSLFILMVVFISLFLIGCKNDKPAVAQVPIPANYHTPTSYANLIRIAGFEKYAQISEDIIDKQGVILVQPPTLPENYNAYAFIPKRSIWLNTPMFVRYPTIQEQAAIFLHELVHIASQEQTHNGLWWADVDKFEKYWSTHPLPN